MFQNKQQDSRYPIMPLKKILQNNYTLLSNEERNQCNISCINISCTSGIHTYIFICHSYQELTCHDEDYLTEIPTLVTVVLYPNKVF